MKFALSGLAFPGLIVSQARDQNLCTCYILETQVALHLALSAPTRHIESAITQTPSITFPNPFTI
jgi:hypothetical protein